MNKAFVLFISFFFIRNSTVFSVPPMMNTIKEKNENLKKSFIGSIEKIQQKKNEINARLDRILQEQEKIKTAELLNIIESLKSVLAKYETYIQKTQMKLQEIKNPK